MRFSTPAAMATSGARRPSVRERSVPPVTRSKRAMPCGGLAADAVAVERAIGGEGGDRTADPIELGAHLRAVIDAVGGQLRRDDAAGAGVHADVQLAPRPRAGHVPHTRAFGHPSGQANTMEAG